MKLLYVKTADFDEKTVGGSITHTIGMINGFFDNGLEEDVLMRKKHPLIKANQIELNIHAMRKPPVLGDYIYHRRFYKKSLKYLEKHHLEYNFMYYRHKLMCFTGEKIARRFKIPCVVEFNSFCYTTYKDMMVPAAILKYGGFLGYILKHTSNLVSNWLMNFDKKILQHADAIVTVSEVLRKELIEFGIDSDKIIVLPNGVDTNFFTNQPEKGKEIRESYHIPLEKVVVGFAGTFGNWHGIDELTETISKLQNEDNEFLLIGDGMMREKMEIALKNQDNVHFTGKIPFNLMPNYLSACDILIVSNSWNPNDKRPFFGSPTKLFEYMAMGKAIVASDLEQIGEILVDDETALLFPTGNTNEMIKAIKKLSDDESLRDRLGTNARKDACENHTWKNNALKVQAHVMNMGVL